MTAATQNPSVFPEAGELFAERYTVMKAIGKGGYSRVYRARQDHLGREVAIKVLAPSVSQRSTSREIIEKRFYREAKLLSKLSGPNTITVFDYGRTSDGLLFMVTELVSGIDLKKLLSQQGALPQVRVRRILTQILLGLREAHANGVLHRDVKPSNIMIFDDPGDSDRAKVLDFGIAKTVSSHGTDETSLTMIGLVIGTPRYMSPEQALGKPVSRASDIFSTGLVAWEMLTGYSPFRGLDFAQIQQRLPTQKIRLPGTVECAEDLAIVIERMLAIAADDRYETAADALMGLGVIDSLSPAQKPEPTQSPRASLPANVLTFPLQIDSSGSTIVDTLSQTGEATQTLLVPDESRYVTDDQTTRERPEKRAEPAVDAGATTLPDESPQRSRWLEVLIVIGAFIVGIVAFVVYTAETDSRAEVTSVPKIQSPAFGIASGLIDVSIRHGEVDARIATKELGAMPDDNDVMEFDESSVDDSQAPDSEPPAFEFPDEGAPQDDSTELDGARMKTPAAEAEDAYETEPTRPASAEPDEVEEQGTTRRKSPRTTTKQTDFEVVPIDDL